MEESNLCEWPQVTRKTREGIILPARQHYTHTTPLVPRVLANTTTLWVVHAFSQPRAALERTRECQPNHSARGAECRSRGGLRRRAAARGRSAPRSPPAAEAARWLASLRRPLHARSSRRCPRRATALPAARMAPALAAHRPDTTAMQACKRGHLVRRPTLRRAADREHAVLARRCRSASHAWQRCCCRGKPAARCCCTASRAQTNCVRRWPCTTLS